MSEIKSNESSNKLFKLIEAIPKRGCDRTNASDWRRVLEHGQKYPWDIHYSDCETLSDGCFTVTQMAIIKHAPLNVMRMLLDSQGDLQNRRTGWTVLHTAVRYDAPYPLFELFLTYPTETACQRKQSLVRARSYLGSTALHLATAHRTSFEVVKRLFYSLPKTVSMTDRWGRTPLHTALQSKASTEVLKFLINHTDSSTIMTSNQFGSTALHSAACAGTSLPDEIGIEIFRKAPAAVFQSNKSGSTPIMLACRYGASSKLCQIIIKSMFPLQSFLQNACFQTLPDDIIPAILTFVPNPLHEKDNSQNNILHWCCAKNVDISIVKEILKRSSIYELLRVENDCGMTPIDICEEKAHRELKCFLKSCLR